IDVVCNPGHDLPCPLGIVILDGEDNNLVEQIEPETHQELLLHGAHHVLPDIHERHFDNDDHENGNRKEDNESKALIISIDRHCIQGERVERDRNVHDEIGPALDKSLDLLEYGKKTGNQKGGCSVCQTHNCHRDEPGNNPPLVLQEVSREAKKRVHQLWGGLVAMF